MVATFKLAPHDPPLLVFTFSCNTLPLEGWNLVTCSGQNAREEMLCYFQNEVMKKLPSVFGDLLPLLIAHSEVASCCVVSFPMEDPCGREQTHVAGNRGKPSGNSQRGAGTIRSTNHEELNLVSNQVNELRSRTTLSLPSVEPSNETAAPADTSIAALKRL